ncbi:MAG: hypothetical protein [Caudoviricetes sp.]|nr:MAG: hypothetical protein [Caudoviricetes sp.]
MADNYEKLKRCGVKFFKAAPYGVMIGCFDLDKTDDLQWFTRVDYKMDGYDGVTFADDTQKPDIILVGMRKDLKKYTSTLAHECYHAMNWTYLWHGCNHELRNDEPGAYFLGSLVEGCDKLFKQMGIQ